MEEGLFHNQLFVNHINENAVAAIAHSEGHAEEERVNPLTGAREKVCPRYDSVPCSAHQAVYQSARSGFDASAVPASFVCDPQGKMLAKVPGQAPQAFIDKLNEAQQKLGRPIAGQIRIRGIPLERRLDRRERVVPESRLRLPPGRVAQGSDLGALRDLRARLAVQRPPIAALWQRHAALVRHLDEQQVGELLNVVAVIDAVVTQRVAEPPQLLDNVSHRENLMLGRPSGRPARARFPFP